MSRPPRILVTRSPHQASALADHLRALGAEPILIPTIEFTDPTSYAALNDALESLISFDWLVFTSANAVRVFGERLFARFGAGLTEGDLPSGNTYGYLQRTTDLPSAAAFRAIFRSLVTGAPCTVGDGARHLIADAHGMPFKTAAIGPATGLSLNALGIFPTVVPGKSVAEALTEELLPHARRADGTPNRFLLIRAEEARDYLPDTLRAAGADLTIAPMYRTVTPPGAIAALGELFRDPETQPDAITLTSSSAARNLFTLFEIADINLHAQLLEIAMHIDEQGRMGETVSMSRVPALASIGPITSATIREFHYEPDVEAPEATVAALAEAVVHHLRMRSK